jgi:SAM-dependent methyltransferase
MTTTDPRSPGGKEFWENVFADKQLMWGEQPTASALRASDEFATRDVRTVLIPGVGYGRNAKPFLSHHMAVTGIEVSATAIRCARQLGLDFVIHHRSVEDMPLDDERFDGIFCFGLLYLLDASARRKFILDCFHQLAPGGQMVFTLIAKSAPMFGRGTLISTDWFETLPGLMMYFYDDASVQHEFNGCGVVVTSTIDEPSHGVVLPFLYVVCTKPHNT